MLPFVGGLMVANWHFDRWPAEARKYLRRLVLIIAGVQALAAIALVVLYIQGGTPVWVPFVFILGAAVLAALCFLVGDLFRRRNVARPLAAVA